VYEQQNTELIKSMYEAFGRGDIPSILSKLTSDTIWTTEGPEVIPYTGTRHGEEGVLSFFQSLGSTLDNMKLTTDRYIAQGDTVATFGRFAGTVKATGKSFDAPVGHYFEVHDGKVAVFIDIVETASIAAAYTAAASASGD
jgi:hypothetical protein